MSHTRAMGRTPSLNSNNNRAASFSFLTGIPSLEASVKKLKEFKERDLSDIAVFAMFIDTVHRGNEAFMVALGINTKGHKHVLGFWQGATENHEICEELLADIERRGLFLSKKTLFVTDGGKGIIKALRERFGTKLLHQRCIIHKDRNIQRHLAKKYRKEAHRRFMQALEQNRYDDAKKMLLDFEKWLRAINESAADSLKEALEEILDGPSAGCSPGTEKDLECNQSHRKHVLDGQGLRGEHQTVPGSTMSQRWLASVILYCEQGFRRIKGYSHIAALIECIEQEQGDTVSVAA